MLASPCCQGHSNARGTDSPRHDASRSTAWAVVDCCEACRPPFFIVENVPEFMSWTLYPAWLSALAALGYSVSPHIINAADCGVPQERIRLFLVGSRSKAPLRLSLPNLPHVPARSILGTEGSWSPVAAHCPATRARVAAGRARFGSEAFLIAYYGTARTGISIDAPLHTVTTHDRFALVQGDLMRFLTVAEIRCAMGFPASYILPQSSKLAKLLLGNAVCPPVMCALLEQLRLAA
jgi:DNA (cytosine-5)-methyltransferase 1